jgi:ethanolamine ammonia-lyase large subunit
VFIAEGFGAKPSELAPALAKQVRHIYDDAKVSIWKELDAAFVATVPAAKRLRTRSKDRMDYIAHPASGERLSDESRALVDGLREVAGDADTQIVISDGLNALAVMEEGQLTELVAGLREQLKKVGRRVAAANLVVDAGRVRAGYRIGEQLFGGRKGRFTLLHIIGERPGSGHHTLSIYMTVADGQTWGISDKVDHNITKVVSGIANTALAPGLAAAEAVKILSVA